MRDTLAVVGAVDIHLAAAIGAIKQACEGSCFAPAVRVASDIPTDFLHKVKGLLVNDSFMGIVRALFQRDPLLSGAIYADPPWRYSAKKVQGAAENHYPTMSIDELCALPVAELAAKDSALFMWATFPQLPEALRLIRAWGFTYKSVAFVWLKKNRRADSWFYGLGFWTRANAEICLLATKGHPKRQAADIHQFIISPIEAHSKKPDETRDKIVALMGDLPRVELFARQTSPGWDVWGNEVEPTIPDFGTTCPKLEVTD